MMAIYWPLCIQLKKKLRSSEVIYKVDSKKCCAQNENVSICPIQVNTQSGTLLDYHVWVDHGHELTFV